MRLNKLYPLALLALGMTAPFKAHSQTPLMFVMEVPDRKERNSFEVGEGKFLLNGQPFVVKAAELHYPRIPKEYWEHRIQLCKALGMNTICLYTFWNAHEPREDEINFEGQNDIREFIRLCQENDMKVILRPGPYVCAEWEMGGLTWWLLKKKDIKLRENDPYFLERVEKFQKALAEQVKDLTIDKGGPILMIQVENEYGSYGEDKPYIENIRDIIKRNFGEDVVLFQCDWSSNFTLNGLDDLLWTMNFGTGANIDNQFEKLKELRPESPLMCSEYWSGWFDKWGANHETRSAEEMTAGIDEMLENDISFSLYMTHGGTNWGHWAGANSPGYAPDVTSYDYDAPINENGQPTPKYWELREVMQKHNGNKDLPEPPENIETMAIPHFEFSEVAPLFSNLPEPIVDEKIRSMEEYDQGFGSIIYSTELPPIQDGTTLKIIEPHDYARVFIDGSHIGDLDRRNGENSLILGAIDKPCKLDILVEAMGRINFGRAIKDYKGITDEVRLIYPDGSEHPLTGEWDVRLLPDEKSFYDSMAFQPLISISKDENGRYPLGIYRGTFEVDSVADTFLNFETWGKGLVYVNGHPLGRIWEIGPQQTLYMPGAWLNHGINEILVFDILGPRETFSEGLENPILDKLQLPRKDDYKNRPDITNLEAVYSGDMPANEGWQEVRFDKPAMGKYLIIEALSSFDGSDNASVAEIYLIDKNGNRLPREAWKAVYADSEDTVNGNHTIEKIFDLQESTYWSNSEGDKYPYLIMIDLGDIIEADGLLYLPRVDTGSPGAIRDIRIYLTN